MHNVNSRQSVEAFLSQRAFALVGLSRSGSKFGNTILRELRAKGLHVYPVHPVARVINGVRCFRRYSDMPEPVNAAIICVSPDMAASAVRDAAEAGIRHIWLQQGAESPYVLSLCHELGLEVVSGECILMFASPTGVHRVHRAVQGMLGRLPH